MMAQDPLEFSDNLVWEARVDPVQDRESSRRRDVIRGFFAGAVGAGLLWTGVFVLAEPQATRGELFARPMLIIAGVSCAVLLLIGAVLLALTTSHRGRTLGVASIVAGLIGPAVVALGLIGSF